MLTKMDRNNKVQRKKNTCISLCLSENVKDGRRIHNSEIIVLDT